MSSAWNRGRWAGNAYADADRDVWLAVPRLAGRAVPRGRGSGPVARPVRQPPHDRREQQQLRPARPPDHTAVAHGDVGLSAVPRGHGPAVAQLWAAGAEILGGAVDRDLA